MNFLSWIQAKSNRQQYPSGTKEELVSMPNDPHSIPLDIHDKALVKYDADQFAALLLQDYYSSARGISAPTTYFLTISG